MIRYKCPHCGTVERADDHDAGLQVSCSRCKRWTTVPEKASAAPPVEIKLLGLPLWQQVIRGVLIAVMIILLIVLLRGRWF